MSPPHSPFSFINRCVNTQHACCCEGFKLQNFQRNSKEKILPLESGIYRVEELYNLIINHSEIRWKIKPKRCTRHSRTRDTSTKRRGLLAMGMRTACLVLLFHLSTLLSK
jgi:hypothetical protein